MAKDKIIAGVIGSVMVLTLFGVGFAIWRANNQKPAIKSAVKSQTTSADSSSDSLLSVGDNTGIGGGINAEGQQSDDISSNSTNSSNSAKQKKEDFSEYEKYKDAKSALFGEIQFGTGAEAVLNKKIAISYKGSLTNNTVFDQSRTDASGKVDH